MKIGIDATCWGNKRGFGRFTRELLEALLEVDNRNEYYFFVDGDTADIESIPGSAHMISVKTTTSTIEAAAADGRRSVKDLWAMSREVLRHEFDVFFFPAVYSYFPVFNRTKIVVTLHDVIADHNPELIFPNLKSKIFWKLKQNAAIRQADLILTVSDYSKEQIVDYFGIPASRLRVINEGARAVFSVLEENQEKEALLEKFGIRPNEKFLLYVGGISPHKNLDALVGAFKRIEDSESGQGLKLVLVGDYKDDPFFSAYPGLKEKVAALGLDEKVIFTGFIPDEELALFYNAATLLVFPSFEEGFGLPAIESMACGTPVVASNASSLPEVIGDAGRFFDPHDESDMARVIDDVLNDDALLEELAKKGLERSNQFLWTKAARDTVEILKEAAER